MLRKTRWLLAVAVTATTLTALPGGAATAGPSDIGQAGAPAATADGKTHTVTLLTGDVVTVGTPDRAARRPRCGRRTRTR